MSPSTDFRQNWIAKVHHTILIHGFSFLLPLSCCFHQKSDFYRHVSHLLPLHRYALYTLSRLASSRKNHPYSTILDALCDLGRKTDNLEQLIFLIDAYMTYWMFICIKSIRIIDKEYCNLWVVLFFGKNYCGTSTVSATC